jgi:chromosome segregation ATPase
MALSRADLTSGSLMHKLLADEHSVAAQNMNEIVSRRDINIMRLSEMCSFLRADLNALEQTNFELSAKLKACEVESQQLRHKIESASHREVVFSQVEKELAELKKSHEELRLREHMLTVTLKETEREKDAASKQLHQFNLQSAAAAESARNSSIMMQAMEDDLRSAERSRLSAQESLAASALERDELRQKWSQAQQLSAENQIRIDSLKEQLASCRESESRSNSAVVELRQEVLRQQQRAEDFRIQIQSSQSLSRAKEEEHFAALAAKDDELVGLRSQICSYESLLKEQQSEISELNSARNRSW